MVTMRPPSPMSFRSRADRGDDAVDVNRILAIEGRGIALRIIDLRRRRRHPHCSRECRGGRIAQATSFTSCSTSAGLAWSALKAFALTPLACDLANDGFRLVRGRCVAHGNVRAFVGESLGACGADAARTAGDESNFSF